MAWRLEQDKLKKQEENYQKLKQIEADYQESRRLTKLAQQEYKPKTTKPSATPYDYMILKSEQGYKLNRSKINWEVYDKLKELDCDFLWNYAGDKVKPIWLADNPNIEKIERLAYKLQR